ncbi:MAG TPA: PASTA domain-containing protein [Candidatus Udaeobacter sp.]|nr:PASTA domain-containing protein [Candidatus Udaeobacter sp.]
MARPRATRKPPVEGDSPEDRRRFLRSSIKLTALAIAGFTIGVLLFNSVVMPRLLGHGEEVNVPDLVGRPLGSAKEMIAEHGLEVGPVNEQWSRVYPDGFVLSQSPAAQSAVKRGREVRLTVSIGKAGQAVPDLVGIGYRDAQVSLARSGLRVGQLVYAPSERMPKDQVLASDPEPEMQVEPGARVDLLVSLGTPPATFVLPNLRGHRVEDVRSFLARSGIRILERQRGASGVDAGIVLEQTPPAGYRIRSGELVEVAVSEARGGF